MDGLLGVGLLLVRSDFSYIFSILLFCHFLADFPLQGDYMAKAKNYRFSSKEVWPIVMFGHCAIHAGFVLLVTSNLSFAVLMLCSHFAIDYCKCRQLFGFLMDQILHIFVILGISINYVLIKSILSLYSVVN